MAEAAVAAPIKSYGMNFREIISRLLMGGVGLASGWLIIGMWPKTFALDLETAIRVFLPISVIGGSVFMLFTGLFALVNAPNIGLYKSGVRYRSLLKNQTWRWDEITAVKGGLTSHTYKRLVTFYTSGAYTFYAGDKVAFQADNTVANIQDLYKTMVKQISATQKKKCLEQLQRGQTLTFGSVKLSWQAVEVGKDSLPMSSVKSVSESRNLTMASLAIYSSDDEKRPWKHFPLESFHNPWLFMDLVHAMITR